MATHRPHLSWKRYWCPPTGTLPFTAAGYLLDPDSVLAKWAKPDIVPFEAISDTPCLLLLGEPGIGKSTALADDFRDLHGRLTAGEDNLLIKNLAKYGSDTRLVNEVFRDPVFLRWLRGTSSLHLLLDSLDECRLQVSWVASLLLDEFDKIRPHIPRLKLRIACRTAELPPNLENGLKKLWNEEGVKCFELAPLTRANVAQAASAYHVPEEPFFAEVNRVRAVPFAVKPVTLLNFLLDLFRRSGKLPATQNALYRDGCRLLCEETSASRRDASLLGELNPDQRMAVAGRIAAVTIFCNKSAIYLGTGRGDTPDSDVSITDLVGGNATSVGGAVKFGDREIREVLGTSLFSSRGDQRLGWSHQTYAEFLAANAVAADLTAKQLRSLIFRSVSGGQMVVPQLHETAAWLTAVRSDVADEVMERDPQVLLRSDVASATDKMRSELVGSLLRRFEAYELREVDTRLRTSYRKLVCSGLGDQLLPYIKDKAKSFAARHFAIEMADACQAQELADALVDVAVDASENESVRTAAVKAVAEMGNVNVLGRLLPLAEGRAGSDSRDQLKGLALEALWPRVLSSEQMFGLLTIPRSRDHVGGAYYRFISGLCTRLRPEDLTSALAWVEHLEEARDEFDPRQRLADEILALAWESAKDEGRWAMLTRIIVRGLRQHRRFVRHESIYKERPLWNDDDPQRRQLLERAVPLFAHGAERTHWWTVVYGLPRLVINSDIPWMIRQVRSEADSLLRKMWVELIDAAFSQGSGHLDELLDAMDVTEIRDRFSSRFGSMALDSAEAVAARAELRRQEELAKGTVPQLVHPPPHERIEHVLNRCEAKHPEDWWMVVREMTLEPRSTHYGDYLQSLTQMPGWQNATPATRARIVQAARAYVSAGDPAPHRWLGRNDVFFPAAAGVHALLLLMTEAPAALESLDVGDWRKWASSIIDTLSYDLGGDSHQRLACLLYKRVPDSVIEAVLKLVDIQDANGGNVFILGRLDCIWDDRLASALARKLVDPGLRPKCFGSLLHELVTRHHRDAVAYAMSLVTSPPPPPTRADVRARAMAAAAQLLTNEGSAGWAVVWPAIRADSAWGRELFLSWSPDRDDAAADAVMGLSEELLADLYQWLVAQFPYASDPDPTAYDTEREQRRRVSSLRDHVLWALKDRGTHEALVQLRRLSFDYPEHHHLKLVFVAARTKVLELTWSPPTPRELLNLMRSDRTRLVNDGHQLLEVVVESLKRWEEKLQGVPPASVFLWDKQPRGSWRPVDEERLSDAIALHLKDDLAGRGIIVNREVVIRRGEKPCGKGERTDVHVDAMASGAAEAYDNITVIIETKGCWNLRLQDAMRTQLADRYLKENPCQHGVYAVGWFVCGQWDLRDSRRRVKQLASAGVLQQLLDDQAKSLSTGPPWIRAVVINAALR